jgi:hypothetical protein
LRNPIGLNAGGRTGHHHGCSTTESRPNQNFSNHLISTSTVQPPLVPTEPKLLEQEKASEDSADVLGHYRSRQCHLVAESRQHHDQREHDLSRGRPGSSARQWAGPARPAGYVAAIRPILPDARSLRGSISSPWRE